MDLKKKLLLSLNRNDIFEICLYIYLLQERLIAIVMGMLRQNKYDFVDVYREEAATALKAVMKQVILTWEI